MRRTTPTPSAWRSPLRSCAALLVGCILGLPLHAQVVETTPAVRLRSDVTLSQGAARDPRVAKVNVSASGRVLLNGQQMDLKSVEAEFRKLQAAKGAVWYYRENGQTQQPTPQALAVLELVVKYKLPISMSSKPDYSDYIDDDGQPQPRTP